MSLKTIVNKLDKFQYSNKPAGFIYAVIKKYGEDHGGYQSALITYYAILSLFPLLVVLTNLARLIFRNDGAFREQLSQSINRYFPVIGIEIQHGINGLAKTGILLGLSLLVTLYGSRGVANVLQFSLSSVWRVSDKRPPFLQSLSRSISIILVSGIGLIVAALLSGYVVRLGKLPALKVLGITLSLIIIWLTLIIVFKLAIAGHKKATVVWRGAAVAAVAIQILQLIGNIILAHELKNLNTRYGVFGLVIGSMFWLYLQAEVIIYASEMDSVIYYHMYPRKINQTRSKPEHL